MSTVTNAQFAAHTRRPGNQVVDRNQVKIGKADGLVAELREGQRPKILYIETGMATKARRMSKTIAKWLSDTNRTGHRGVWSAM